VTVGPWEIMLVVFLVLLVVGPKQLPRLARSVGESIRELRGAVKEADPRPALKKLDDE
jgi:sec-independent protein translocase protein TatA